MEISHTQRLAKVLRWLVTLVFACNLLLLPLLPGYVLMYIQANGTAAFSFNALLGSMRTLLSYEVPAWEILLLRPLQLLATQSLHAGATFWLTSLFFLGCGLCTACILWQARHILGTIVAMSPFQMANAVAMERAALGCWGIAALALLRLIFWFVLLRNSSPLFTYTALLVPLAFVLGLLFLVMSALFRQAAELKEDNDLTI